jgi:hypothetical protein
MVKKDREQIAYEIGTIVGRYIYLTRYYIATFLIIIAFASGLLLGILWK